MTKLYKSAYNEGGQVKVESHPMWTQLLSVVTGESSAAGADDSSGQGGGGGEAGQECSAEQQGDERESPE